MHLWKLGGRITSTNTYFFYLIKDTKYGLAAVDTAYIPVTTFWGSDHQSSNSQEES